MYTSYFVVTFICGTCSDNGWKHLQVAFLSVENQLQNSFANSSNADINKYSPHFLF